MWFINNKNELYHHGILGQKWGIRRYQNADGSYTEEGKKRYFGGRNGYAKRYEDYYQNAKKEYIEEKGGKSGYKKYYKEEYVPEMEKKKLQVLKGKQLVDSVVEGRLKDAYIKDYGGLDEYHRDKYAKLTNDAIRNTIISETGAILTAAAGAATLGIGVGVAPSHSLKEKEALYNMYDKKVRYKDVKNEIADPERLKNKFGISEEEANERMNKINDNDNLIRKAAKECLKDYKDKNSLDVRYLGPRITRDNDVELSYAVYDKNDDLNYELKSAILDPNDKKVSYIETFQHHPLKNTKNGGTK